MCGPAGPRLGLRELPALRVGALRLTVRQLALLPTPPAARALAVLDERQRGSRFLELPVRSVLNTPATTRMARNVPSPFPGNMSISGIERVVTRSR